MGGIKYIRFILIVVFFIALNDAFSQNKYLFVDDSWISSSYAVNREMHVPVKAAENPLVVADKPWEGGVNCFGTVLYDEGKFRMWYQIYNGKEKKDLRFATMVGYAESTDGIKWTKPELGLFEYKGNKNNNITLTSWGSSDLYSPAVVKDMKETNPARRYKMLYWDAMSDENVKKDHSPFPLGKNVPGWTALDGEGFFAAFSADGIHWEKYGTQPVFTCACDASSVMQNEDGSFSAYFKMSVKDDRHFREIGKATSTDFMHWSEPQIILSPDWKDAHGTEFYGLSVTEYYKNFIGLIWMYYNSPDDKGMDIQIATSRDGKSWERAADRKVLLTMGNKGEWDAGGLIPASQLIVAPKAAEDKIYLYYGGTTTRHDDSRAYHRENSIGLATLRIDGFASMDAKLFKGYLITNPIKLSGNLFINADAKHGFINIEILDAKTKKIIAASKNYENFDNTKLKIDWSSSPDTYTNKDVLLKFNLKKASLYSFWFE